MKASRVAAVVAGVIILLLSVSFLMEHQAVTKSPSPVSLDKIAARIGLTLPPGARLIGSNSEAGIDSAIRLKIETSEAGLAAFLRDNDLDPAAFEEVQHPLLLPDDGWWDPSSAPSLPTAQIRRPNGGPTLDIGYARHPAGTVAIYIFWFTT